MSSGYLQAFVEPTLGENEERIGLVVFDCRVTLREGEQASCDLEVKHAFIDLIGKTMTVYHDDTIVIKGSVLSSVPSGSDTVLIRIVGKDKPDGLAHQLRTGERYNALAIPEESRNDISELLSSYLHVLDFDPITGLRSFAPIIWSGEASIELEPFDGTVSVSVATPPVGLRVSASAEWNQSYVEEDEYLLGHPTLEGLRTFTAEDIVKSWPKKGDKIGQELTILDTVAAEVTTVGGRPVRQLVRSNMPRSSFGLGGDFVFDGGEAETRPPPTPSTEEPNPEDWEIDPSWEGEGEPEEAFISEMEFEMHAKIAYEVKRQETMQFSVPLNLQSGIERSDWEDLEIPVQDFVENFDEYPLWRQMTDYSVGDVVQYWSRNYECLIPHNSTVVFGKDRWKDLGVSPRLTARRQRTFFDSAMFLSFTQYMVYRAEQRLTHLARCVDITFEAPFPEDLSTIRTNEFCRVVVDSRTGDVATGKITQAVLTWKENGEQFVSMTISCTPGNVAWTHINSPHLDISADPIPSERPIFSVTLDTDFEDQVDAFQQISRKEKAEKVSDIDKPAFSTDKKEEEQVKKMPAMKIDMEVIPPKEDLVRGVSGTIYGDIEFPQGYLMR